VVDRLRVMVFGLYFVDCTVLLPSSSHRKLLQLVMLFRCVWLWCEDDEQIVMAVMSVFVENCGCSGWDSVDASLCDICFNVL
jgi:hypothetical protein